ncbi:hypothetical protein [Verrucomicrobium spinosum]|uniref:hypothetical protein n=1 Tax=Verrucomicrobium spinosum TaxID=2736 RepID=UPI000174668B|nr:hypothetical protein [Verrucomicrobium spinosum]
MLSTITASCLPPEARTHVQLWTARMEQLTAIGRGWTTQSRTLAQAWGVSQATLTRFFYAYQKEGVLGLIDKRKYAKYLGEGDVRGLPPAFISYWQGEYERFQRNGGAKQTYRVLMDRLRQWRRGNTASVIPGYSEPPANQPGCLHPRGWSYENLTKHLPDQVERTLARQGRSKAKALLSKVYTTRVGLDVGQVLMIDDQYHDINVAWSNGQVARPQSFNLLDFFSGYEIMDGFQPRLEKEDGSKLGLKEEDAFWMILTHFSTNGYRADLGTHVIVERGTATVRNELAEGFLAATDKKIIIDKGGMDNRALKGLIYDGPAKGNFRFKASRESVFNLWRNMIAALPGATGRNREESPEEQKAIISYVEKLLKKVPQERWHLLKLPVLTEAQFMSLMVDLKEALRDRHWHTLEGWKTLGHTKTLYRLPEWGDDQFVPIEDMQQQLLMLPPERAELITMAFASQAQKDKLIEIRNLSPREVWDGGKHKLTRLTPWTWNQILPGRMAHVRHVEDREIRVYGGGEILRYDAHAKTSTGRDIMLRPGEQFMIFSNPLSPDIALCCDTTGAAIGLLHRIVASTRIDHAAVISRMGRVSQMNADVEAPVAHRAEALAAERAEQQEHNDRVIKGLPVTPKEHEARTKRKAAAREAASILDEEPVMIIPATTPAPDAGDGCSIFDL